MYGVWWLILNPNLKKILRLSHSFRHQCLNDLCIFCNPPHHKCRGRWWKERKPWKTVYREKIFLYFFHSSSPSFLFHTEDRRFYLFVSKLQESSFEFAWFSTMPTLYFIFHLILSCESSFLLCCEKKRERWRWRWRWSEMTFSIAFGNFQMFAFETT